MRIALTLLSGVGYGGVTYFQHLTPALAALGDRHEYHCFVPERHPLTTAVRVPSIQFHEVLPSDASALDRFRYEQLALPGALRRRRIDVLFTAKNLAVFRAPCRQVIAIRNMEPFRYRAFANAPFLNVQSRVKWELTKRSIERSDGIVCVSRAVRDAVVERFPDAAAKAHVIYNGNPVSSRFRGGLPDQRSAPFLLTASKFVAYANQLRLVEAYGQLLAEHRDVPQLWFAGGVHDAQYFQRVQRRVAELGLTDHVRFLGLIPQDELHQLMRSAVAFVFPSMVEACPHTLIEAMACGVPIATSTTPPMPEIAGEAAVYFDPEDRRSMAMKIRQLLEDAALRTRLTEAGRVRVQEFTWEKTARGLVDVFERVGATSTVSLAL